MSEESLKFHWFLPTNGGSRAGLEIHPNVWAGVGLVRELTSADLVVFASPMRPQRQESRHD